GRMRRARERPCRLAHRPSRKNRIQESIDRAVPPQLGASYLSCAGSVKPRRGGCPLSEKNPQPRRRVIAELRGGCSSLEAPFAIVVWTLFDGSDGQAQPGHDVASPRLGQLESVRKSHPEPSH